MFITSVLAESKFNESINHQTFPRKCMSSLRTHFERKWFRLIFFLIRFHFHLIALLSSQSHFAPPSFPFSPSSSPLLSPSRYLFPCSSSIDLNSARRKNATRESTATLKAWLQEHIKNPYPTKGEKIMLAIITKMTLTQVSTWFANARRRLKKENKMTWSPRNRGEDEAKESEDESLSADNKSDYGRGPELTPLNTAPGEFEKGKMERRGIKRQEAMVVEILSHIELKTANALCCEA